MSYEDLLREEHPWSELSISDVATALRVNLRTGIRNEEALLRRETFGLNELPSQERDSWIILFFRQFQSALIYLLLLSCIVVLILGEYLDASIILFVLIFNAIVGTIQEGRAEATLDSLKKITHQESTVIRNGEEIILEEKDLVPGDLVILKEGERVPADLRLIQTSRLRIDEAPLTGESLPVFKNAENQSPNTAPFGDRLGMAYKGTYIVSGHGQGLVVATGVRTELGKISQAIISIDADMPLKKEMRRLSIFIVFAVFLISVLVFWQGLRAGQDPVTMLKVIISLAVSIIPEGLPVVMTLVLATGVWRMAKHQAVVKRLQAVEALGQTDIIAVDKTGTLTRNELVSRKLFTGGHWYDIGGNGYEPRGEIKFDNHLIEPLSHPDVVMCGRVAALSTSAHIFHVRGENNKGEGEWKISGDPTEGALLVMAAKIGFHEDVVEKESPRIDEIPFTYEDRIHASLHRISGKRFVAISGAPEAILPKSISQYVEGEVKNLSHNEKLELQEKFRELSKDGFRVLALAFKEGREKEGGDLLSEEDKSDYTFVGFSALEDSPRPEVKDSIMRAREAGIQVVMITGDHALTATAIATRIGLISENLSEEEKQDLVLTGEEVDRLSDKVLQDSIRNKVIFARVTPIHKLRLITAYKNQGKVVAMTGDGVNDAPSLVAADLGVAMGKIGTDVAKEAADIVLLDDNFGTILDASEEGRNIYQTIKKVILYLFSTSLGEVLTIGGALFLGTAHLPLLPAQIVWLNLVTDGFLTTALAVEPREKNLLKSAPKKTNLVDHLMFIRMPFMAVPMMVGALYIFYQTAPHDITKAWAMTLTTLSIFQWFNAWNCRSSTESIFKSSLTKNPYLLGAMGVVVVLQLGALYLPPMQTILKTTPLTLLEWLICLGLASTILISEETRKFFARAWQRPRIAA
ncbi:MAG: HAD-IC family P-type ATPase [Anaplasmataceae bacterium]|nr:HAD-IC family P-type ATPase [Anaplasmataceae bacterium]